MAPRAYDGDLLKMVKPFAKAYDELIELLGLKKPPMSKDGDGIWQFKDKTATHTRIVANFSGIPVIKVMDDINAIVYQLGKRNIEYTLTYDWDGQIRLSNTNHGDIAFIVPNERAMEIAMFIPKVKI